MRSPLLIQPKKSLKGDYIDIYMLSQQSSAIPYENTRLDNFDALKFENERALVFQQTEIQLKESRKILENAKGRAYGGTVLAQKCYKKRLKKKILNRLEILGILACFRCRFFKMAKSGWLSGFSFDCFFQSISYKILPIF